MLGEDEKTQILNNAREWFRSTIAANHIVNTLKLVDPNEFKINPFLAVYLSNFLTGNTSPEGIAKALVYPRVLGTSITTSFGTNIQSFTSNVLGNAFGSTTTGIDIEFIDCVDGRRKYCQIKSGPETINKDDVISIARHFRGVINLARTNSLNVTFDDMIVGVIYGRVDQLSAHYRSITEQHHFPVFVGVDFWYRLTGDINFYHDLIRVIGDVATASDFRAELDRVIEELSQHDEIIRLSNLE